MSLTATLMLALLSGLLFYGIAPPVVTIGPLVYRPCFTVSVKVPESKSNQVFQSVVSLIQKTSTIDMSDNWTAYALRNFKPDADKEALRHFAFQYIDKDGMKTKIVLLDDSKWHAGPPEILLVIGYGKQDVPDDLLTAKVAEVKADVSSACAEAGVDCVLDARPSHNLLP